MVLDNNAAGHGWYIDATPLSNHEYLPTADPNIWKAKPGSEAAGKMDLLSVLLHEYGHALGLQHSHDAQSAMAATLTPGTRRLPTADELTLMSRLVAELQQTQMGEMGHEDHDHSGHEDDHPTLPNGQRTTSTRLGRRVNPNTGDANRGPQYAAAVNTTLTNGDFGADGTATWVAEGDVRTQGEQATLVESASRHTHLAQAFTVTANDRALMFTVVGNRLQANGGALAGPGDAFEAALVDANTGLSVVGTVAMSRSDALLNIQTDGTERVAAGVRRFANADGSVTYVIDLPAALTATNGSAPVLLSFDLLGFGTAQSSVSLRDVRLISNPLAFADAATLDEDTVAAGNLLANDVALAAAITEVLLVDAPAHGTVVLGADGRYTYTPAANYFGADSFSYRLVDADGRVSNTATVQLEVRAVNDAPVVLLLGEQQVIAGQPLLLLPLAGATDVEGDALSIEIVSAPSQGSLVVNADGSLTYTAEVTYAGEDSFSYRVTDGTTSSAVQGVRIVVLPANTAPVARPGLVVLAEDGSATVDFVQYGSDAEGDALTPTIVQGSAHGTLVLQPDGRYVYTPEANFHGVDAVQFTLSDGRLVSEEATLTFTVSAVNDAPVAVDAALTLAEDGSVLIDFSAYGRDVEGSPLQATITVAPAHGTLTLVVGSDGQGRYVYTPNANFNGVDALRFTLSDGEAVSNEATLAFTITAVNDAPTVADRSANMAEDGSLRIDPLQGAVDVDGDVLVAVLAEGPAHGTVVVNPDGSFSYTPNANFYGADSFSYRVSDGQATSALATVSITVTPVNDAPVANSAELRLAEDGQWVIDFGALASDAEGTALVPTILAGPAFGTLERNSDGSYTYTPNADFHGVDMVRFAVSDGEFTPNEALLTFAVQAINDVPTAQGNTVGGQEDEALGFTSSDFAPADVDGDELRIRVTSLPAELSGEGSLQRRSGNGQWVAVAVGDEFGTDELDAGVLRFVPLANTSGGAGYAHAGYGNRREHYARFDYVVSDGMAQSAEAFVTIDIAALADAPRLQLLDAQPRSQGLEDGSIPLPRLSAALADADGSEVLMLTLTGLPVGSVLSDTSVTNGSRSFTVTADRLVANITGWNTATLALRAPANFSGTLQLQVQATAIETATGGRATLTQNLEVKITAVADAPVLSLTARNSGATVSREVVGTSWETVRNRNHNATLVAGGPGITLEGWRLVTPSCGGQNMFEIWSNGDRMRNAAGNFVTVHNAPGNGQNWLQLNDTQGQGHQTLGIERDVATVNGAVYNLSLDYAAALGLAQDKARIGIYIDGQLIASYANTSSLTALNWQALNYQFVGNGQARRLTIQIEGGSTANNGRGAMIDDIRVVETLPAGDRVVYGLTGSTIMLPVVNARLTDTDGSETLKVELLGLRVGTVVSDGANTVTIGSNGLVNITGWNLANLRLVPPACFVGTMQLCVRATATEASNGATAATTQALTVHVLSGTAVATPVGVNPFVSVSGGTTAGTTTGSQSTPSPLVVSATPLMPAIGTVRVSLPLGMTVPRTWEEEGAEDEARRQALSEAWLQ